MTQRNRQRWRKTERDRPRPREREGVGDRRRAETQRPTEGRGVEYQEEQVGRGPELNKVWGGARRKEAVEVSCSGGKKKVRWVCPKKGRGEERPRENEQHKKDIWKAFQHDPPFLLPPSMLPASVGSCQEAGPSPHTCVHTACPRKQLLGSGHRTPKLLLSLSGPPWIQGHQLLSVSMMHLAGT